MENDSKTIRKIKEKINEFALELSRDFKKPCQKFIRQIIFGIQAAKDVKLSNISRCKNEMNAVETPIGYLPHENDIDMTGLRIPRENMRKLLAISKKDWKEEAAGVDEFFKTFGKDLPREMNQELKSLKNRLK